MQLVFFFFGKLERRIFRDGFSFIFTNFWTTNFAWTIALKVKKVHGNLTSPRLQHDVKTYVIRIHTHLIATIDGNFYEHFEMTLNILKATVMNFCFL